MPHPPALTPASEAELVARALDLWHGNPGWRYTPFAAELCETMEATIALVRQHDATAAQARLDALLSAYDAAPGVAEGASDAGTVEALREAALFLKDRLDEWQNENLTDEGARDWCGHVEPAVARLAALAATEGRS